MTNTEIVKGPPISDHKQWTHYTDDEIEQIRQLAARGYSAIYIGRCFNVTPGSMRETLKRYNIKLRVSGRRPLSTKFGYGDSAEIFRRAAAARGTTVGALATRLLEVIAHDDMFDAILDDRF